MTNPTCPLPPCRSIWLTGRVLRKNHKQLWNWWMKKSNKDGSKSFRAPQMTLRSIFLTWQLAGWALPSLTLALRDLWWIVAYVESMIPERTTLPSAKDVIRCFPLRNNSRELSGFSLDIKSAHKRVVLKESEQGLLGFSLNDSLYFYRVCLFGATFSAYWWQRLGGWILRFFHQAVWIPHAGWLYVDDYLWLQHRDILLLVATFLALPCRVLNIPISWRKTELDVSIHWIGWSFHFSAGYIAIPKEKRVKLIQYIDQLVRHSRTPRTYLEKVIGLIMWITQLFPFMRIWVRHLYHDLYSIPCTNYSMDPGNWPQLPVFLNDQLQFKRQPASSAIPIGSTLVSVRHHDVTSKDDLHNIHFSSTNMDAHSRSRI